MTTIDFGKALQDAKSASFEAMPIGDYNVEVVTAEAVIASTGRPMIKCKFKVIDGPYMNRPVMTQFVLVIDNPNALSMFFRNMKAFGITEQFFAQLGASGSLEPVAAALVGRRAQVTLGIKPWQGEDRNEVKSIKAYNGAPGVMMPGVSGGPGPIAGIPTQVMAQAAANFNPTTQLPNQQMPPQMPPQAPPTMPAPAAQMPPQPPQSVAAPVAPPVVTQTVQAPVASESTPEWMPTQEEVQAATPAQIPTAADTAPPAYVQQPIAAVVHGGEGSGMITQTAAHEPQVQQFVTSDGQPVSTPPVPPV